MRDSLFFVLGLTLVRNHTILSSTISDYGGNKVGHNYKEYVQKLNALSNDLDALYHQAAKKFALSDSVLFVTYMIHEKGDGCLLHDICSETHISKQTINSAIRKLEQDNILFLEADKGRNKRIRLTVQGKVFVESTASRLLEAECNAFSSWSDEELEMYVRFMERYNHNLQKEIAKL